LISEKWTHYKDHINLVNPANKRNLDVIIVGTGLAGGSAAATLAELGYNVKAFASRIPRVARTRSQRKAESMRQKLPRRWRLHFQIVLRHRKKEGITAPGSQRTVWPKYQQTL
jgi:flavin-dependent dehydrogenase